uniref:Tyrosyl-DNA phosphodiesterase 2 n=1 Tax=Nothobranchius rachovii TaxID=451742 RepID=A0A1A8R822_9TELE
MEPEKSQGDKTSSSTTNTPENSKNTRKTKEDEELSLITWNVDVQPYVRFMYRRLADTYTFIKGGETGYFTMMLLKKSRLTLLDSEIVSFPNSSGEEPACCTGFVQRPETVSDDVSL